MSRSRFFSVMTVGFATAVALAGCSGDTTSGETTGSLDLTLELAPGVVINEVAWTISRPGMADMDGTIDTSAPGATASVEVFGLPPGGGYTVTLTATPEGEDTPCIGSADFSVQAGVSTPVMVMLNCKRPERYGGVRVNGEFNICAELAKVIVSPLRTSVGNDIDLSALGHDVEGDNIAYLWTANSGTIDDPTDRVTTYTCEEAGTDTITITVSDDLGEFGDFCMDAWDVDITCVEGDGGTDGSGGSSGTGGTGGTGGGPVACEPTSFRCRNGVIDDHMPCCEQPVPDQANACDGTEPTENPASCTVLENPVTHRLTLMEVEGDCNIGYDLDSCEGKSCFPGGLAPAEGLGGIDNAVAALAPTLEAVGANLSGVNQALADTLCGRTDDPQTGTCDGGDNDGGPCTSDNDCPGIGGNCDLDDNDCMLEGAPADIRFVVDANPEEGCANVTVLADGQVSAHILNLSGDGCASGTLGLIPISIGGIDGALANTVVRMTVSADGFSDGTLGATIDENTAVGIAEALLEGGGAVVAQVLDINASTPPEQDTWAACNALSSTLTIGGIAEDGTGGVGGGVPDPDCD